MAIIDLHSLCHKRNYAPVQNVGQLKKQNFYCRAGIFKACFGHENHHFREN